MASWPIRSYYRGEEHSDDRFIIVFADPPIRDTKRVGVKFLLNRNLLGKVVRYAQS